MTTATRHEGTKTRVHAALSIAVVYDTFLTVTEEGIVKRISNSLRNDGYGINEVVVMRWLAEPVRIEAKSPKGRKDR